MLHPNSAADRSTTSLAERSSAAAKPAPPADDPSAAVNLFGHIAVVISAVGGLIAEYNTGVISGAILFIKDDFSLSPPRQESVVSAVLVGTCSVAAPGVP